MNPLRYPAAEKPWDEKLFQNPSAEYRGAPLWCWNNKLQRDQLLRQIDSLEQMGMGGFHIHSRIGLDTPYMGKEFMEHVEACTVAAKDKGLLACLYDEDRWPSGAAGGLVVAGNPEFKALHLLLTKQSYSAVEKSFVPRQGGANGKAMRSNLGELIARYDIWVSDEGGVRKQTYRRLGDDAPSGPDTWFVYAEPNPPSAWFNDQTYVDTLNAKAIGRFIETTHEKYYDSLGSHFGQTVPSIFTDEPQFAHKSRLARGTDTADLFLPWSMDLPATFKARYGYDVLDELPSILWNAVPAEAAVASGGATAARAARYHFHDHVCERFVTAFMDQVADWCRQRNIALIGHMMKEPTLLSQTQALGEAMRCYRSLDMPGVDMLCDGVELNTVKQATSVARQNGSRGVMSEIYGVTNWTFDFAGHKGSGDWQAALGITFRVHHLTWVSMAGEGKRDYPASIGYQSPWYKEYKYIEDHFSRVNVAMTRGKPGVRVAVIHPIESFWLCYGPTDNDGAEARFREEAFEALTSWLLFGLVDFDFVSESLLPEQTPLESIKPGAPLPVGHSQYDIVLVPNLKTIRASTLERLERFSAGGGRVLVAGTQPSMVNGLPASPAPSMDSFTAVPWTQYHILSALEDYRDVRIVYEEDGSSAKDMLYQLRKDGDQAFLFICSAHRQRYFSTTVGIRGRWAVTVLDTLSGERWTLESAVREDGGEGWTWVDWHFEACGSVLFELAPLVEQKLDAATTSLVARQTVYRDGWATTTTPSLHGVELSEPNVLVLDYAAYSLDDGPWAPQTEILRIDNLLREQLSLPLKGEAYRQPWAVSAEERVAKATLRLRYEFTAETTLPSSSGTQLALELVPGTTMTLDGTAFAAKRSGWWVDEDISVVDVPLEITPGRHVLELMLPFGLLTNLERMYLLGTFAVEIRGRDCRLQQLDLSRVAFGNWAEQGLPFYAGNLTYKCRFTATAPAGEHSIVQVPHFSGPVMAVFLDGARTGTIALQPHVVDLGVLQPQRDYALDIVCYGNRENSFGTLHMPNGVSCWFAPNAWRTEHDWWIEGYNVKPMGILDSPKIKSVGKEKWTVPRNPERLWTCLNNRVV